MGNLWVCTRQGFKQASGYSMRVNSDVGDVTVGGGNVVVERTDLVFKAKLLADVGTRAITEDVDGLLDWAIG